MWVLCRRASVSTVCVCPYQYVYRINFFFSSSLPSRVCKRESESVAKWFKHVSRRVLQYGSNISRSVAIWFKHVSRRVLQFGSNMFHGECCNVVQTRLTESVAIWFKHVSRRVLQCGSNVSRSVAIWFKHVSRRVLQCG